MRFTSGHPTFVLMTLFCCTFCFWYKQ